MADEVLIWMTTATAKERLLEALRTGPFIGDMPGASGVQPNPKRGALKRAIDQIPDKGLLKVKHLLNFMQVVETQRERLLEESNASGFIYFERPEFAVTAANLKLKHPDAFVKPPTLQRVIDRFNNTSYE